MAPLWENWLLRGVQSAIFFYAQCGPCINMSSERQRRKDAEAVKMRNEKIREENPDQYMHPAAYDCNPYWREEQMLGPSLPTLERPQIQLPRPGRYRRADEEFVYQEEVSRRPVKDMYAYRKPKAPAINDLHPPVVSLLPSQISERRWMKLPPPSTAFIEAKKGTEIIYRRKSKRTIQEDDMASNISRGSRTSSARHRISSDSDEHADDEDDDIDSEISFLNKPRSVHRSDATQQKRTLPKPKLPTVLSYNSVLPCNNNDLENTSPRTIPISRTSAESLTSSNESLAFSHQVLVTRSNSSNIITLSPQHVPIKSRVDSQQENIGQLTLDMEARPEFPIDEMEFNLAKEHIWLGARARPAVGSKRWSVDF